LAACCFDGYGGEPVHHATILLANNRIIAAGPASEIMIPPGTPVIDTRGETMMPGMIEVHAHHVRSSVRHKLNMGVYNE
jgi:imidazolonepropionase-like amidohydrolase